MALTFDMKVTGLCSGVVDPDRKRIDTVLINANSTMTDIPYHLQTLLIDRRYVVPPPDGLPAAPRLASYRGRVDIKQYKIADDDCFAWDLNGAVVRVCENRAPLSTAQLDIPPPVVTGEYCSGDWSDLHWVLDVKTLADAVSPGLTIDPDWRTIGPMTLAVFEMLKGSVRGANPYYEEYARGLFYLDGTQYAQSYTDSWMYEYVSPDDNLLLEVDRDGVRSYIACSVPDSGATVSALLLNEGTPASNPYRVEHMLAYYDLLGPRGAKLLPTARKALAYDHRGYEASTALGDGAFCMSTMLSRSHP
jgi:hypothetical protein